MDNNAKDGDDSQPGPSKRQKQRDENAHAGRDVIRDPIPVASSLSVNPGCESLSDIQRVQASYSNAYLLRQGTKVDGIRIRW